jgi:hypothetical protein
MKRKYIRHELWEEIKHNMWGDVSDHKAMLEKAIEFTGNANLYGEYMIKVVDGWPNSCTNALTDDSLNKRAWIGHAACALALGCPEDITRKAWGLLTDEQRFLANKKADRAIAIWRKKYEQEDSSLYTNMEEPLLL